MGPRLPSTIWNMAICHRLAFKLGPHQAPQVLCFLKYQNSCFYNLLGFKFEASPVAVPTRSCKDVGPKKEDKSVRGRGREDKKEVAVQNHEV